MSTDLSALATRSARVMGLVLALLAVLFALDAFNGQPLAKALADFTVHLVPAVVLGFAVAVGWRYPWGGAILFGAFAAGYALMVGGGRLEWILVVSGPLALTAILFALSARARGRRPAPGS